MQQNKPSNCKSRKYNRFWSLYNESLVKKMRKFLNQSAIENRSILILHFSAGIHLLFLLLFHTSKFYCLYRCSHSSLNHPGLKNRQRTFLKDLCTWFIHLKMIGLRVKRSIKLRIETLLLERQKIYLAHNLVLWM